MEMRRVSGSCLTNVRDKSVLSLCLVSICRQHGGYCLFLQKCIFSSYDEETGV